VDLLQKPQPFLVAVSLHTRTDHSAVQSIEGGKQSRCSMAFVVVRHRSATSLLQGQTRLGPVQGLDLRLLVHTQDQGVFGGIDIKPDHVTPTTWAKLRMLQ
jgi:hypothetical protein